MNRKGKALREFLQEAHDRFEQCVKAESELREKWLDDLRFEGGEQWPEAIRRLREKDPLNPRPCITINKTQLHVRQIVNDLRQNRPQIKVLPVDGSADLKTAEIYSGLIRNIESVSDADIAIDTAAHPAVSAGIGYFRVSTKVVDAKFNHQTIEILPVWNPLSVYLDPEIQHPAGADAQFGFVVEDIPEATFKRKWPNAKTVDFRDKGRGDSTNRSWFPTSNTIRVAEYYYLERELQTFYELDDGEIVDSDGYEKLQRPPAVATRQQYVDCCYWAKLTGAEILEETKVPTRYIPIVRVAGIETVIDGKRDVRGIVREMKDPARVYNYWVTLNTELVALAPKNPILAPMEAIEGHQDAWDRANVDNLPYLPWNHVDDNGQPIPMPQRTSPPQQSTAIVQAIMQADSDIMAVAGRFEASLGEAGNEKSGRAIIARQRQGDNATFHFADNLTRAIRHVGRILVDMIPKVYDTARVLRVLGEDGSTEFAQVDPAIPRAMVEQEDMARKVRRIYNLGVGTYDVTCVAGPSYATKRQEAAEMLTQLSQADPTLMQKAGDIIVKAYDMPGSEELSKRLKAFLPPEIMAQESDDGQDETQAAVMQAQEATKQQLMAEIGPVVQELQGALQQAEMEAQKAAQEIEALKQQLANKQLESETRIREAEIKAEAEAGKTESEVLRLVLEKALTQPEEQDEPDDDKGAELFAALAAQIEELRAEAQKPKRKQVRINEFDADGMPVGAEVIEE